MSRATVGDRKGVNASLKRIERETEGLARILVVDDTEASRYLITRQLLQAGYEVSEAGSVGEALDWMGQNTPELVVLDIALPDGDGLDLCRHLRSNPATARLPIVQTSATFTRGEDYARGLDSGADSYLPQPIDPPVLLATIRSLLRARRAETARDQLAAIVENADEPIISKDLQGVITSWNAAAERVFGFTAAEAIGRPLKVIIPPELWEQEEAILEMLARGEPVEQLETVRVGRDGHRIDALVTVSPIRDDAGRIVGSSKIIRDITHRKQAEEAVRSSEARLKMILENLHEGLIVVNGEGTALHWNQMALEMHGYTRQEEPLRVWSELVKLYEVMDPEGNPVAIEEWPIPRLIRQGSLNDYELRVRHKQRQWERILNYGGVMLEGSQSTEPMGLLTIRDVTEQRRAAEALRTSEERYRCFVKASSQVVWTMNPVGEAEAEMPDWNAYTGQSSAEAQGFGWLNAIWPEDREAVLEAWRKAAASQKSYQVEYRLRRKDGSWRHVLARAVPILDGSGKVREWTGTCTDITERKEAEAELRENRNRLAMAQRAGRLGVFDWDMATGKVVWSEELEILAGLQPGSFEGTYEGWAKRMLPEDLRTLESLFIRWQREKRTRVEFDFRIVRKDGEIRWFAARGEILYDLKGAPVRMLGTNADITERKRVEEGLRLAEERLDRIISSAMDAVISINAEQRIVLFNPAAERLFRIGMREAIGKHINEFIPERFRKAHSEDVRRFGQTGDTSRRMGHLGTLSGLRANGEEFPIEASISHSEVAGEQLFTVILRDISDRKRDEERLQRQAALIDLTPTAMLVRSAEGRIRFWNRGAETLYGWTREQAVGCISHELLQTELSRPMEEITSSLNQTGRWSGELRHHTKEGREVVVQSWWRAERGPEGEITEILESSVDVTERKRFQEELEKLVAERTARLRETVGDLEHFSYTITHDMRAPLRAMQAFGQMLEMDYQERLDETGRDYLKRIIQSSQRMDHLITDALSYAKIVREEMSLGPVNTEGLLKGMVNSYPEFQPPKAEVRIMDGIPWVIGNNAGLTQCFSNLLGNAVKFVRRGTTPQVRVWGECKGEWVRLWVEDNGIGISPEDQKKIFTMFQRLSKEHEGTGIGLALVQKVVDRMRGRVGVESELGSGSRFWVELPLAAPTAEG